MSNSLITIPVKDRPKSQFNGNHFRRFTSRLGDLTPVKCLNYHPGDSFKFNQRVGFTFPPLLAPAYQKLQQRLYNFRIPKHLTWNTEKLGRYLLSTTDGSVAPQQPYISLDKNYYYGASVIGFNIDFKLPVYGVISGNNVYLQKDNLPDFLTVNHLIFNKTVSWDTLATWANSVTRDKASHVQLRAFNHDGTLYKHCMYNYDTATVGATHYIGTHNDCNDEVTLNNVKFASLDTFQNGCQDRFIMPPYARPMGLLEALGYPVDPLFYEDPSNLDIFDDRDVFSSIMIAIRNKRLDTEISVSNVLFASGTDYGALQSIASTQNSNTHIYKISVKEILMIYAQYMITHGHGDGTLATETDIRQMPLISCKRLYDIMNLPTNYDGSELKLDMGRFLAYWLVIDNYFRDNTLSKPLDFTCRNSSSSFMLDFIQRNIDHDSLGYPIAYDGVSLNDFYFQGYGTENTKTVNEQRLAFIYYTTCQRKVMDRNLITACLPTTTNIEVFAPTLSADYVDQLRDLNQDLNKFKKVDSVTPNQVSSSFSASQGHASYAPRTIGADESFSFISVDAFRTAEVLQNFFTNAMLVGDRPVALIMLMYGVHSKDFRHEVPELLSYTEDDCQIREISQSSETSDSLPLGAEGGKVYSASANKSSFIEDEGDFGYILTISCVYPVQHFMGGLDYEILAQDPWTQLFMPDFAELGEEELPEYYVLCRGHQTNSKRSDGTRFGFVPRYQKFRSIKSENVGRFNLDLKHWHDDIYFSYNDKSPVLSQETFYVNPDVRMFALPDEYNCLGVYFNDCEFSREIPKNYYSLLG